MDRKKFLTDACSRLMEQGCFAKSCWRSLYRHQTPEGVTTKCLFGGILPDELYDPNMEGSNAPTVLQYFPQFREHFEREYGKLDSDYLFLKDAQWTLHDGTETLRTPEQAIETMRKKGYTV